MHKEVSKEPLVIQVLQGLKEPKVIQEVYKEPQEHKEHRVLKVVQVLKEVFKEQQVLVDQQGLLDW